jgi:hypothetical protein
MRCLKLIIFFLAYAVITPAFAEICCPNGCSQDSNRCVYNGTQNTCPQSTCGGSSGGSSGGSGSGQKSWIGGQPPQCIPLHPTKATVNNTINKCISDLTGSAQFVGCAFEDAAGMKEDKRTGLSCADRQAALAKQCVGFCADFAKNLTQTFCIGQDPNYVWQMSFGGIGGFTVGSARVDLCGPALPDGRLTRLLKSPARPYHR